MSTEQYVCGRDWNPVTEECLNCGARWHCGNCGGAINMQASGHLVGDVWVCKKPEVTAPEQQVPASSERPTHRPRSEGVSALDYLVLAEAHMDALEDAVQAKDAALALAVAALEALDIPVPSAREEGRHVAWDALAAAKRALSGELG